MLGLIFTVVSIGSGQHINDVIHKSLTVKYDISRQAAVPKATKSPIIFSLHSGFKYQVNTSVQPPKKGYSSTKSKAVRVSSRKPTRLIASMHGHLWFAGDHATQQKAIGASNSAEGTYLWTVALSGTVMNIAIVLAAVCLSHK